MKNEKELMTRPQAAATEESERLAKGQTSQAPAASPDTGLPSDLAAAYNKLLAEKEDLYDRLLRKQAELENSRKRLEREKEDFLQHATADLVRALLPVLDGFERALNHRDSKVPQEFYEGMELIYRNLLGVLGRAGLAPIQAEGKIFDPHVHQAVETVEAPGHRDQEVLEELQRGYKLKHRLLRPAVVKVAVAPRGKGPEALDEESDEKTS